MRFKRVTHQFSLFDFNTMRPKKKVPISAERVREAKAAIERGDTRTCLNALREIRYRLEAFESRL